MSSDQVVAGNAAHEPADGFTLDEPAVRRALESVAELERTLGPDHPDTLNARNSLAAAYQAAGRVADAISQFENVLVARQRVLGPRDADTLTSQDNLAATYQAAGRHAEANLLFKLTLAAREGILGADHPGARTARDNLAAARQETEARQQYESQLSSRVEESSTEEPPAAPVIGEADPEHPPAPVAEEASAEEGANAPSAAEPPAAAAAEETPVAPADEQPAAVAAGETPVAPADEQPAAVAAGETGDLVSPEPTPEPEAEPGARPGASELTPPAEEPPPEPLTEQSPAAPSNQRPWPALDRPARRRRRVLSLVAAIVIVCAGGGVAGLLTRPHAGHHGSAASYRAGSQPLSAAGQLAAVWVAQQVARNAIVACDPLMCVALEAQGVPAANLLVLRAGTVSPLGAQVVVVTPAIRGELGSRVNSVYAPSVIAGFGSGPGEVSVQVVAQGGPAAYLAALRQDATERKTAGAQLLANKHIQASAAARAQLAAGAVDSRLLIMLPALAAAHPIQVLAFDPAPGAGLGVPLCTADLSGSGQAAGMSDVSYLRWLTSFVGTQLVPFAGRMSVLREAGQSAVRVVFSQPSPLGLLSHA